MELLKQIKEMIPIKKSDLALFAVTVLGIMGVLSVKESVLTSNTVGDRELPVYCVETEEPKIALTFDAAWGNEDTKQILDILAEEQVHVTFFMTGGWIESFPEDVKAIYQAGHELGNHSENHKHMTQLSTQDMEQEIMKAHDKVKKLTDYDMKVFRPPYGDYSNDVVKTVKKCGYQAIQWDVDTLVMKV